MSSAKEEHGRRGKPGSRRRRARLAAVQALYQIELTGNPVPTTIAEFRRYRLSDDVDGVPMDDIDLAFFGELVTGVGQYRSELDRRIAGALTPDWPLERLDIVLREILRAASYELLHCPQTPAKVVISEYMALANSFFSGREPALVNGVLDTIARRTNSSGAHTVPP